MSKTTFLHNLKKLLINLNAICIPGSGSSHSNQWLSGSKTLNILAKNKVTTNCERNFQDFFKLKKHATNVLAKRKEKSKNKTLRPSS